MIVTSHRPGYMAGSSVLAKVARADAVVWLDDVRFTTPGFVNRNQLADGTWLTVPIERPSHRSTIREVAIAPGDWANDHIWQLRERFMEEPHFDPGLVALLSTRLAREGEPLVELNLELLSYTMTMLGIAARQFRQRDYPTPGGSLSSKLVRMVKAVGGTAYLSGPTTGLDPDQFEAAGIELLFFRYAGDNPAAIDPIFRTGQLPTSADAEQEVHVA